MKVKYSLVDCKIISDYTDINLFLSKAQLQLQEWCLFYDKDRSKMFNLHFVNCKCNKTLFVTFMADLELADGRERFRLSKKELASLKRLEHNRTLCESPME